MLAKLSAFSWMMIAVFAPPSRSSAVNASVVVTNFAVPSWRTCSDVKSPLAGWLVWPAFWKCAPAELKSPGAPPVGATELASHFPTEWMCRPWKPGANWPGAVVSTVTVAKPPANSMSAVATVVPLASFSWAVSFSPLAAWFSPVWPCPSVGDAEGDGEPVQTDGVVPGEVATCSGALHALKATTGTAKTATTETGLSMCKRLTGDRHDHARRLLGQLGDPRLHGRLEQLADLVGGFVLARRVAEEHRGARDLRQAQVAGLGHVPAGVPQPSRGAFGDTFDRRDVVHTHVGLRRRRGRDRRCRARGADGCGGDRRRLIAVRVAGAHRLEPDQQEHHAQEQQHHDHGTQRQPGGVSLVHYRPLYREGLRGRKTSGDVAAQPARRPGLLPTGPQPSQPFDQHRVSYQLLRPVHQRSEHLIVTGGRHREELLDGVFLGAGVLPPLALKRQDVVLAPSQSVGEIRVIPGLLSPRDRAVHIGPGPFPTLE